MLGTRKAMAPRDLGLSVPQNSPKLDCRGQGESCGHLDKPVLIEGVLGNHPERLRAHACREVAGVGLARRVVVTMAVS